MNPCTTGFLNCTDTIGIIIGTATTYTTGDIFITLFIILLILLAMFIMAGMRIEYTMILIMPMLLVYMAYYQAFVGVGILIFLYLAIVMTYNFIIR